MRISGQSPIKYPLRVPLVHPDPGAFQRVASGKDGARPEKRSTTDKSPFIIDIAHHYPMNRSYRVLSPTRVRASENLITSQAVIKLGPSLMRNSVLFSVIFVRNLGATLTACVERQYAQMLCK